MLRLSLQMRPNCAECVILNLTIISEPDHICIGVRLSVPLYEVRSVKTGQHIL